MPFNELFIRRPVVSIVLCLLIIGAGMRAAVSLPLQRYPKITSATVVITTTDYGVDAATMAGFVTTPIENAVSSVDGVDYLTSNSAIGVSTVTLYLRLNQDPKLAVAQVEADVSATGNQLPVGTQQPEITMTNNERSLAFIAVSSRTLRPEQISDYVSRIMLPQLQAVPGVMRAVNSSKTNLALRIWFDANRLTGYGMTATDAVQALAANNYVTGVGATNGRMTYADLAISSDLHTEEQFRNLVLARRGSAVVRLGDVAEVRYGSESTDSRATHSLGSGQVILITPAIGANLFHAEQGVKAVFARIQARLPPDLKAEIIFDAADFVRASLHEVMLTLVESAVIVSLIILLCLGSLRSVLIPLVTIPVSLIGTLAVMSWLGFSINTLTLLAFVLAIGLVVDDAIIVVENVSRHIALGRSSFQAALLASRELTGPIIAMTVVLVAAYAPVGLQQGLTGALFTEFAFTLAISVIVSAVLALTLSPLMCAHLLGASDRQPSRLARIGERGLHFMQRAYGVVLRRALDAWPVVIGVAFCLIIGTGVMFREARNELAPQEDIGLIALDSQAPPSATLDQVARYDDEAIAAMRAMPEMSAYWLVDAPGSDTLNSGMILAPWDRRHRTATAIQADLQGRLDRITGLQLAAYQPPSLPGPQGMPIQFVIKGAGSTDQLAAVSGRILTQARKSGLFAYVASDLGIDQPRITVDLDRNQIAELGLDVKTVADSLSWLLGGGYVNYFSRDERSYRVMTMVTRDQRLNPEQILNFPVAFVPQASGPPLPVPLSAVATLTRQTVPEHITHFQSLEATTLQAIPRRGVSVAQAYAFLQHLADRELPGGFATDTAGSLREFVSDQGTFLPSFGFSLAIVFLTLAALFGSFRDPLVILVSVPMSLFGAVLFLWIGWNGASVNLYSEIGLVSLAGLISKHGILIVEMANEQRRHGAGRREAIEHAAMLRLRPILMTTAAMVLGVLPLLVASGAGAAPRFVVGLVLASGLGVGTVFTLFVVPAFYVMLAHRSTRGAGPRSASGAADDATAPGRFKAVVVAG